METPKKQFNKRRVFISENEAKRFQVFSFTQESDGSIYVSWPDFVDTNWLTPIINENGELGLAAVDSVSEGKLSIHGTGMGAFRSHDDPENRPLIIKGNKLLDLGKGEGGARHLFTAFVKEPVHLPNSPALNRPSDYLINTQTLEPFVIIFFAIPQTGKGLELNFQTSFHTDDVMIPPPGGWGVMDLKFHDVFWYVYRTNNMEKWPKKSQVVFHDGFMIPVFIGTGLGQFRLEFRTPKYSLDENKLVVEF